MLVALALSTILAAPATPAAVPITDAPAAWGPAVVKAHEAGRAFQKALQLRLGEAMKLGGPTAAIDACATDAARIAAETSATFGVKLGRTSDRLRNPSNAPPEWTRGALQAAVGGKGADILPAAVDLGAKVGVLLPITAGSACLGCHGPASSIRTEGEGGHRRPLPGRPGGGVFRGRLPRLPLGGDGEVSPIRDSAAARLGALPWSALQGLAPALAPSLTEMLSGAAAERVLDRFLRSRRGLDADGRRAAAEAIFGVGLWRRRLRFHVGEDAPPLLLLASLLRDLARRDDAEALCALPEGGLPAPVPPPEDLATRHSLPGWLAAVLEREAGDEAPLLAEALNIPGPIFLRANRARTSRDALAARLATEGVETRPTHRAPDGLEVLSPRPNLLSLPAFQEGLLEVQDEGSQLLGEAVGALPGDTVLDLCAGAGGRPCSSPRRSVRPERFTPATRTPPASPGCAPAQPAPGQP